MMEVFDPAGFTNRLRAIEAVRAQREQAGKKKRGNMTIAWGLSQVLGLEPPMDPSTVSRWFSGAVPDLRIIWAIAHYYDVNPGWLVFGEAVAEPPEWLPNEVDPIERPKGVSSF